MRVKNLNSKIIIFQIAFVFFNFFAISIFADDVLPTKSSGKIAAKNHPIQLFNIHPQIGPNEGAYKVNITGYGFFEPDLAFIFKFHSGDALHGEHEESKTVKFKDSSKDLHPRSSGKIELELPKFPAGTTYVLISAKCSTNDAPSDPVLFRAYNSELVTADIAPQNHFFLSKKKQKLTLTGSGFPLAQSYWVAFSGIAHKSKIDFSKIASDYKVDYLTSSETLKKLVEASYVSDSTITCEVPTWPEPGEVQVAMSFNGEHFPFDQDQGCLPGGANHVRRLGQRGGG